MKKIILIIFLMLSQSASALNWGWAWGWSEGVLHIDWDNASTADPVEITVYIQDYTGVESIIGFVFNGLESHSFTVYADTDLFYCGKQLSIKIVNGSFRQKQTHNRPVTFPPLDTLRCTRRT